jgi:orotidine-5'-phosphate decarboxylase
MTRKRLIEADRSLVVAADVPSLDSLRELLKPIKGLTGFSAAKLGIELALDGLARSVNLVREVCGEKMICIYDHQKAANDIPEMGPKFAKKLRYCGVSAAILFPFAGPKTQEAWIKGCQDEGLHVLVGSVMTHPEFLVSEGGYISDKAPEKIFSLACELGVRDFVVPGTKLYWVQRLRTLLDERLGEGGYDLSAPGFITQGGDLSECGKAAGQYFHSIVGRALYGIPINERRAAAELMVSKIV